jgi:hypothetical protein
VTRRLSLLLLALLLSAARVHAGCGAIPEELVRLSRDTHSTLLLSCSFHIVESVAVVSDGAVKEFPIAAQQPRLSPNAKKVAFTNDRGTHEDDDLVVLDLSTGATQIVRRLAKAVWLIGWNTDGTQLVTYDRRISELQFTPLENAARVQTAHVPRDAGYNDFSSVWGFALSANQKQGIITEWKQPAPPRMYLADLTSGRTEYIGDGWDASWAPREEKIAFIDRDFGACREWSLQDKKKVRLFGRAKLIRFLLFDLGYEGPLVWSPDQRFLVFHEAAGMKLEKSIVHVRDLTKNESRTLTLAGLIQVVDWK